MRKLLVVLPLLCVLPVACNLGKDEQATTPKGTATVATGDATLKGSAFYLERIMLPPGGALEVELFSDRHADAPETLIARQRFTDIKGPPYEFALGYPRALVLPGGRYSLKATLYSADGRAEFATDTRVPVNPASAKPVQFRLVRVPGI